MLYIWDNIHNKVLMWTTKQYIEFEMWLLED